uniref:hypothetical protein n=1 Tax=Microbispora cellulosiformans TaxID=2614688 RepID=UPI0017831119|nr:hypothetical protein [Microbispora cellulosiformans]
MDARDFARRILDAANAMDDVAYAGLLPADPAVLSITMDDGSDLFVQVQPA